MGGVEMGAASATDTRGKPPIKALSVWMWSVSRGRERVSFLLHYYRKAGIRRIRALVARRSNALSLPVTSWDCSEQLELIGDRAIHPS